NTNIGLVQTELDAVETGAGLNTDGTYTAPGETTYLGSATSLYDADGLLDSAITTEVARALAAEAALANAATSSVANAVAVETARAEQAESDLSNSITTVSDAVGAET